MSARGTPRAALLANPGKRQFRPREPVAVAPSFVSQLTSLQLLGVDARRYLDSVVPLCAGSVSRIGKLRLLPLNVAVSALRELAATPQTDERADDDHGDDQPETCDAVLAALGFERKAS